VRFLRVCSKQCCCRSTDSVNSGHSLGKAGSPLNLEIFIDHLCPDSSAAYATVASVLESWNKLHPDSLQLTVIVTSLPYHHNSWFAAKGGLLIQKILGDEAWFRWTEAIWKNQDVFYNAPTANMTANDVLSTMIATVPMIPAATFLDHMMNDDELEESMRVAWKYAESRSCWATPLFYLNGVMIPMDSTATVAQWMTYLNSLSISL
jgi:hypothetical protein